MAVAARTRPNPTFYAIVLVLAAVAPRLAAFGFLAIALLALVPPPKRRVRTRGDGPSSRAA
jgi:hypothetical protein